MQIETMQDLVRVSQEKGSHFFDRDAMRCFQSRVSDRLYPAADGTVVFVTSERFESGKRRDPRRWSVRRFDPVTGTVAEVSAFQAFKSAHAAHKAAAEAVGHVPWGGGGRELGPELTTASEEFARTLRRECAAVAETGEHPDAIFGYLLILARRLMRYAATYHRLQEIDCNRGLTDAERAKEGRVEAAVTKLVAPYGMTPIFSGDPRGCCLKLTLPSGYTDDMAHEGLCVPIRGRS